MNEWSYTFSPPIRHHSMDRVNFTFTFTFMVRPLYSVFFTEWCLCLCALQGRAGPHVDSYACLTLTQIKSNAMLEKVIHQPLTAEVQIQYWANPCGISGGIRGTGSGFFPPRTSAFPGQYYSTNVPYSIIYNYKCHWMTPMWNKIWMSQ